MRTALAFWRRSQVSASTSTHVFHRPDKVNWLPVAIKMGLSLILAGNLLAPFAARAQNLGTSPQFGQAVQGQQATTVEGTVLNIVNWGCNVIAPVIAVACLGIAGWHFKSGRGYMGCFDVEGGSGSLLRRVSESTQDLARSDDDAANEVSISVDVAAAAAVND